MGNFKGTKGKWKVTGTPYLHENEVQGCFQIKNEKSVITATCNAYPFYGIKNIEESEANALLISKAPEMLEMLNKLHGEIMRNDGVLDVQIVGDELEYLIKSAADLPESEVNND